MVDKTLRHRRRRVPGHGGVRREVVRHEILGGINPNPPAPGQHHIAHTRLLCCLTRLPVASSTLDREFSSPLSRPSPGGGGATGCSRSVSNACWVSGERTWGWTCWGTGAGAGAGVSPPTG